MDKLLELATILKEQYLLLEKAKSDYYNTRFKSKTSRKTIKVNNERLRLIRRCDNIEQKIAIEVILDKYKFISIKDLKIKTEYHKNEKQLHILYGLDRPLSEDHGHCIINILSGDIYYHRPLGGSHGSHNYLAQLINNTV